MKHKHLYIALVIIFSVIIGMLIYRGMNRKSKLQPGDLTKASFDLHDKRAGGTYAAFKLLPSLFESIPQVFTKPFTKTYTEVSKDQYSVYAIVVNNLYINDNELQSMLNFVDDGNDLFIAANNPGYPMEEALGFTVSGNNGDPQKQQGKYATFQTYKDTTYAIDTSFKYDGLNRNNFFDKIDSGNISVLGYNGESKPDFIRVSRPRGNIFILLNPYVFSNYFLVQEKNVRAIEIPLSYIGSYANVYWDDYYRKLLGPRTDTDFSEWKVLMRYPAMRWALFLTLILVLIYLLIESKRRQRISPKVPALTNTSLEFVDAMGQLYYQQHNNYNIAQKMIVHLLEYIRLHYYLNTNMLNEEFINALTHKTMLSEANVRGLIELIHHIQLNQHQLSDEQLMELYQQIQSFYLNTK